jgi:uncharacterized membrane protein (TIGR02234 family)
MTATSAPTSLKREYGIVLLVGAVGAVLVLLAVRQRWAQAVFTMPRPLSPEVVNVSGADLVPLAGALALAALAGLAAVIATRGVLRRVAGALLAVFGAGAGAAIMTSVTAATVVSVAASKVASPESAAVSGAAGSTTSGTTGGGARGHDRHALARGGAHRCAADLPRRARHGAARRGLAGDVRQVRRARRPPGRRASGGRCAHGHRRDRHGHGHGTAARPGATRRLRVDVGVAQRRRGPDSGRPGGYRPGAKRAAGSLSHRPAPGGAT